MRGARERRTSGYAVSENSPSSVPFAARSQPSLLPGGLDCGFASVCQNDFEFATPIRSGPRAQYAKPNPDVRWKIQTERRLRVEIV